MGVKAPPVRIDSQAKYGALARGDGAIYMRFPHKGYREKIWDHAAGYIVVTGTENVVILSEHSLLLYNANYLYTKMRISEALSRSPPHPLFLSRVINLCRSHSLKGFCVFV